MTLPESAEVVVVGGGTAGAVVAARLAEAGRDVLVLEAGPDPGPFGDPRWPADLVDATRLGTSYDWGFDSGPTYVDQVVRFERARVIGGCSAHNGAVQTWGHRSDYDDWGIPGLDGRRPAAAFPARVGARCGCATYDIGELTPWQHAWYDAAPAAGLPHLADLNDLDETVGIAPESVNVVDGVRWNTAFAYLDPVRDRLTIAGDALVDRVLIEHGRARGVALADGDARRGRHRGRRRRDVLHPGGAAALRRRAARRRYGGRASPSRSPLPGVGAQPARPAVRADDVGGLGRDPACDGPRAARLGARRAGHGQGGLERGPGRSSTCT